MDVKSLYTNIPNSEGITAAKRALDKALCNGHYLCYS